MRRAHSAVERSGIAAGTARGTVQPVNRGGSSGTRSPSQNQRRENSWDKRTVSPRSYKIYVYRMHGLGSSPKRMHRPTMPIIHISRENNKDASRRQECHQLATERLKDGAGGLRSRLEFILVVSRWFCWLQIFSVAFRVHKAAPEGGGRNE